MIKAKWAFFCSAVSAVGLGAILCIWGIVPTSALSYRVGQRGTTPAARALSLSLPSLSSPLQSEAEGTKDGTEAILFPSQATFSSQDFSIRVPDAPEKSSPILQKTYYTSLEVNNQSPKEISVQELLNHVPDLNLNASKGEPQILIVHTHTSESYNETGQDWYNQPDLRSTDNSRNMVHMGEILETTLSELGYGVIHCQKRHDEDFNKSYTRSNETVREYLGKYPSIAVVIDLHRDSLIDEQGTKYRPTVTINGEETAQIMLLMGVGNDTYPHPQWKENLSLALRIQEQGEALYPGLMRPVLVRPSRYNQYLSNGAILVELGACGNTPAEAERAARLFGEICAKALDRIREDAQ